MKFGWYVANYKYDEMQRTKVPILNLSVETDICGHGIECKDRLHLYGVRNHILRGVVKDSSREIVMSLPKPPEENPCRNGLKLNASFRPGGEVPFKFEIHLSSPWRRILLRLPPLEF